MYHMKTVNVRDVRNRFSTLEAWVEAGERIEIRKRGKPIAWLVPVPKDHKIVVKPDFASRRKAIWGEKKFSHADVKAMREAELEGEQG